MKERPILFNGAMVRALLDGSKTQTRRVVKQEAPDDADGCPFIDLDGQHIFAWTRNGDDQDIIPGIKQFMCPYGQPGEWLWVRESFCPIYPQDPAYNGGRPIEYDYAATYQHGNRLGDILGIKKRWKPSIHMPRAASRITLEITRVSVERLQYITEDDALAEGCSSTAVVHEDGEDYTGQYASEQYQDLWEYINGPRSWSANPWVWVVEFKRVEGGAA